MATLSIQQRTDVLVIGGGMAGCMAAYAARQAGAEVLLVDKAAVGYSGCSYFAAGTILCYVPGEDDLEEWVAAYAEEGAGLAEPAFIEGVVRETWEMVRWLDAQGAPISRTPDGRYRRGTGKGRNGLNVFAPMAKVMPLMRDLCQRAGVEIANRLAIAGLVEEEGAVHGAVGFSPRSGLIHEIEARSVVLAAGGCGFRAHGPGQHMASGDGWRMAYEAGAVLANMEYGSISGLWIDDRCATSLRGLYAAGDAATSSRFVGAMPGISGAGVGWAAVSGRRAGAAAAAAAKAAEPLDASRFRSVAADVRAECLSQGSPEDAIAPHEAIAALQRIVLPMEVNLIRHGVRLEAALARLRNLAEEIDLRLGSEDPHRRMVANEVRSMLLVAEMQLLSAAARTESRGAHYREDHPDRDDAHWRKSLLVKRGKRGPVLDSRPVSSE